MNLNTDSQRDAFKITMKVLGSQTEVNRRKMCKILTKGNEPSCKLLEKLKFTQEGFLRDYNYWKGEYISEYMYSFLEDEYKKHYK